MSSKTCYANKTYFPYLQEMANIFAFLYVLDTYKLSRWKKAEYYINSMQYLIVDQYLIFTTDNGKKKFSLYTMAPQSDCTFMIFIENRLYPLIKINISKWLFNYKIYNLFLT